jgi:hypothetical protein
MVRFFLHTGLHYRLIGVRLHRKVLSWRLWMLFRMRWVRRSIRQKLLGIITILEHSGPQVGFEDIAFDLLQARFRIASGQDDTQRVEVGRLFSRSIQFG